MDEWQIAALALQVLGVLVTAVSIVGTARAHPNRRRLHPVRAVRRWGSGVGARLARWFGRGPGLAPPPAQVTATVGQGVLVRGEMGPLPDDPADRWAAVDARLRSLHDQAQRDRDALATERQGRSDAVNALRDELRATSEHLEGQVHEVATEGLGWQMVGVVITLVGIVAQTIASTA